MSFYLVQVWFQRHCVIGDIVLYLPVSWNWANIYSMNTEQEVDVLVGVSKRFIFPEGR